jgi:hypothetical protein
VERLRLTEEEGYEALRAHVVDRALAARAKYGPVIGANAITRLLADPEVVRFPTTLVFDSSPLLAGEFACALARGAHPRDGFTLAVHPVFASDPDALPYLVAYHVPTINYLDVVTNREAELFGAALLGLEVEEYYRRVCALADRLGGAVAAARAPTCACGSSGGCGAGG